LLAKYNSIILEHPLQIVDNLIYKVCRWIFYKLMPMFEIDGTFYENLEPLFRQAERDQEILAENMAFTD